MNSELNNDEHKKAVQEELNKEKNKTVLIISTFMLIFWFLVSTLMTPSRPSEENMIAENWSYAQEEDSMSAGKIYFARTSSINSVNFDFPYEGEQHALLTLRTDPKYGKDIIFEIEKGQILCSSYDGCNIPVRFDSKKTIYFQAVPSVDHNSTVIFIKNYSLFVQNLLHSKRLRITPTIYQEGVPVFEFKIDGFKQSKYKPSK